MGLFRRLRSGTSSTASGAQADEKSPSPAAKDKQSPGQKFIRRTPSLNLLNGQPRASTYTNSAPNTPATPAPLQPQRTGGKLPWSSRKKSSEPPSVAYEDTTSGPPPRAGFLTPSPSIHSQTANGRYTPDPTNVPTIATSSYDSPSPKTPSRQSIGPRAPRPPPPSASVHSRPGLSVNGNNGYAGINVHHRSPSQATVISLDSTFTAGSRESLEWKQEGGILGKLGFEDDWGGLGDTLPPEHANAQPSAPPQRPKRSDLRDNHGSSTPAAPGAGAAGTPNSPVKKITTAFSSKTPSATTNVPAPPLVLSPTDATEELDSKSSHQGELPEEEKRNRLWARGRKSSRSKVTDAPPEDNPPPSPPKALRTTSQTGELAPAALRRPSSNLFHNPFGRTTSRSSLPLDSANSANDDGSFQLKSFRHISGASGADSKLDQYFNLSKSTDTPLSSSANSPTTQSPQRHEPAPGSSSYSTPLTAPPPRPRLSKAAGSSGSQQNRVSIAEFRKNIRRPSSSMLTDDDDLPLSLSRAQLQAESAVHRNSSAVSLGSDGPSPSTSMARLMPSVSPVGDKERKVPSSSPLSRPQSAFLLGANDASMEHVKPRRSSNDPNFSRGKNERTWPDSPTGSEASPVASPTTPTGTRDLIRGPRRRDSLKNVRKATLPTAPEPHTMPADAAFTANALALSASSGKPSFAPAISDDPAELEGIKLPPRPDEIPDEPVRVSRPPSRNAALSPGLTAVLDEPLRRISGLWTASPTVVNDDREEAFDPSIIAAIGNGPPPTSNRDRPRTTSESNRVSLYDRLNSVTSAVTSVVPPISIMKGGDSPNKLYIPPVPDSPEKRMLPKSPASDRTASPVRVAPQMEAPPVPPPNMPHSSFGRPSRKQPGKARTRKDAVGWDTSSEDEDDIKKSSPVIAAPRPLKSAMKQQPSRTDISSTSPAPLPAQSSADDSEPDEPLRQVRARASSRQELRSASRQQDRRPSPQTDVRPPSVRPPSRQDARSIGIGNPPRQDLRVDTGVAAKQPSPRGPPSAGLPPNARHNERSFSSSQVSSSSHTTATPRAQGLAPSSSKWSLSDSSPTGSDQPSRPPSRPGSRARMNRVASNDRLNRVPSNDRLRAMPGGVRSSHYQTSPHSGGPLAALNHDTRHSASPASSQSALTGDSSMQQPSTPRSNTDNRRSWGADARLRTSTDTQADPRARPPSQFDWMNAAGGAAYGVPGMDPAAYAQAQAAMMSKQQMYAQWMAAAQAHFDDAWERASSVSNAQTLPGNNPMMSGMPMGYSYGAFPHGMAAMQAPPPAMFNMYGGYYGMPAMPFPGGMSSGMSSASGMAGMGGMGMGGGMYSYAPPAQSVFGGEFGPPVQAPFTTEPVSQSGPGGSPRRSRAESGPRPQSVAVGDMTTPPRARPQQQRRASGMAMSEVGGPVSSWRGSRYDMHGAEQTPRARRPSHANAS